MAKGLVGWHRCFHCGRSMQLTNICPWCGKKQVEEDEERVERSKRRKASEIPRAELLQMISKLRGTLYSVGLGSEDEAEVDAVLEETSFDLDAHGEHGEDPPLEIQKLIMTDPITSHCFRVCGTWIDAVCGALKLHVDQYNVVMAKAAEAIMTRPFIIPMEKEGKEE